MVLLDDARVEFLHEERYLEEHRLQRHLEMYPELIALDEVDATALPLLPIG
jgi:hypothetical protein